MNQSLNNTTVVMVRDEEMYQLGQKKKVFGANNYTISSLNIEIIHLLSTRQHLLHARRMPITTS